MSLDWNVTDVKIDDKGLPVRDADGNLTGLAQTVIFMSMFVDLGRITPKNAKEFYERARLYERALGALRQNKDGDLFLTEDEVRCFIGLQTNVIDKSRKSFETRLGKIMLDRLKASLT